MMWRGPFPHRRPRLFYGWVIASACVPILLAVHGFTERSLGLFFQPLHDEFGWSAAVMALGFSLNRAEAGFLAPVAGYLTDRLGGRRMMLLGTLVMALGFVLAGQVTALWQFYGALLIVFAGASMGSFSTLQAVLVRWFDRYLGRALGILNMAPTISSVMIPITAVLISRLGWRYAFTIAGATIFAIAFPFSFLVRSRPQDYGLLPDGRSDPPVSAASDTTPVPPSRPGEPARPARDITLGQALRMPTFWLIAISLAVFTLGHNAERLLIIPHLEAQGLSREVASLMVTLGFLLVGPPMRLLMGWLADRVDVKRAFPIMFVLQAGGLLLLSSITHAWQVLLFALVYETAFSANLAFQGVLVARYFGRHRFASIRGLMVSVGLASAMGGPVLGGAIFDLTGSYRPFFLLAGGLAILGIPPIMLARPVVRRGA